MRAAPPRPQVGVEPLAGPRTVSWVCRTEAGTRRGAAPLGPSAESPMGQRTTNNARGLSKRGWRPRAGDAAGALGS
eukprot:1335581-Pyramimonas_sp.AAC.1